MKLLNIAIISTVALTACAPKVMSVEEAHEFCTERAQAAAGPKGKVSVGINNKGQTSAGIEVGVTSDFLQGRDPRQVFEDCVRDKTGQGPIRPLEL